MTTRRSRTHRTRPASRRPAVARPRLEALEARTLLSSFTPLQIRHAYGFDRVGFVDASHPLVAGNGQGQTIAIVDAFDDPNIAGDLATFDSTYGLPAPPTFSKVNQRGGTTPPSPNRGWSTEIALDVEYSHAMAPAANILLVEADSNSFANLNTAVQYAANNGASAVSMSYGAGEFSGETSFDSIFTHPGVTYFSSTGDSGAPGGYQAFSPNVVAVGGTSLFLDGSGNYSSESGWGGSGGGISQFESQPAYQQGVVTQSATRRTIPDLSFVADPNTGVIIYDTYNGGGFYPIGGTSASSPIMAGLSALVNQGRSYLFGRSSYNGQDFLNALYHLPQTDLHDITTGNNGFAAGPGYDLVTGRGTPIADRFVSALIGAPVYDPLNGALLVTGGGRGGNDAVSLSRNGSQLTVQVATDTPVAGSGIPASQTFTFNNSQYGSVGVSTGDGSTTVTLLGSTPAVPVTLTGDAGTNTLRAPDTANTWNITGTNAGTLNGTVTFSGFQNLTGGAGTDTFLFGNGAGVSGTVDGGGGTNLLDYSAYTSGVTVDLSAGTATGTGGVRNVQQLRGGQSNDSLTGNASGTTTFFASPGNDTITGVGGTNTLVGPNADSTWAVSATNAGTLTWDSSSTTFTGVQDLAGGSGADTFALADGAGVSGTIDGGGGANTLDLSAYSTPTAVDLGAHTATGLGGFANIQSFVGAGANSTLRGPNAATTWHVTGSDAGNLTGGFAFTGFGNLTGGSAADDFVFSDGASVDGTLDGGGGANALDLSAYSTPVTVDLTAGAATGDAGIANIQSFTGSAGGGNTLNGPAAATTWSITAQNAGTLSGGFSFTAFQNLTGGAAADTFLLAAGVGVDGLLDGGGGTNTLLGPNAAATWSVTAQNAGTLASGATTTAFADMQNLTGGSAADTFVLSDGVGVDGVLDGGGGANTLDESAYSSAVAVDLSAHTATGLGGGFANLQSFVGPGASGTLHGPNATTTWNVTATDAGNLTGGFGFTGFGNLTGGSAADDFVFSDGASVDGTLDGGGGANALDLSAYSTPVTVDLTAGAATGDAGFANVQSFTGSAGGGNALNGPAAATTWNLGGSNAGTLTGGFSFALFQNLNGGAGNNTFVFANGAGVDGTLTGGGGTNALDYSAYTTTVLVDLQTGTATGVGGGIANVQNVTGGRGAGGYNILVGNGGNVLTGGNGRRSLLIAGPSAGTLTGGNDQDVLIAGSTAYDTNLAALQDIMSIWTGPGGYTDRVNQVTDPNYQFSLNPGTVASNGGGNALVGKPGGPVTADLYFANLGAGDTTDAGAGDTVVAIS